MSEENPEGKTDAETSETSASCLLPTASGRWLEVVVSDTGIGIPAEAQEKVFDKFYQMDSSETPLDGAVGLGLYIAKQFTELLGGEIALESEVGKGTTFTVRLPA